jgi:hypothetical protein
VIDGSLQDLIAAGQMSPTTTSSRRDLMTKAR